MAGFAHIQKMVGEKGKELQRMTQPKRHTSVKVLNLSGKVKLISVEYLNVKRIRLRSG